MQKWFINRYGEIRAGWAITSAVGVLILAQLIARPLAELGDENDPAFKLGVTLVYGVVAIAGTLLLFKLLYRRSTRELGLTSKKRIPTFLYGLVGGFLAIASMLVILVITTQATVTDISIERLLSLSMVAQFLSVCVFVFSEELTARGFFMTALKTTRNRLLILLIPATIFALLHLMNGGVTAFSLTNTFLVGVLFGYMFIKSGTLWLPVGFHIAWNFFIGDVFGMVVSEGTRVSSVLSVQMGTSTFWTGGSAGPEGSVLCTLVLLAALLAVRILVKTPSHPEWTIESGLPMVRR